MRRQITPMSAIIADDEELARAELRFLLEEIGDVEIVGMASNGLEAVELIRKLDPALAFLDIQMPGLDGLSVVRKLREQDIEPPHVIFSTAWDQFAVEAFRLEAMDFILKPVERERLVETLERSPAPRLQQVKRNDFQRRLTDLAFESRAHVLHERSFRDRQAAAVEVHSDGDAQTA